MKAYILGAVEGSGNIGDAISEELREYGWRIEATDCAIGDGSRPPGGNIPNDEVGRDLGYSPTEKGPYRRFDAPAVQDFAKVDADALIITLGSTYKDHFTEVKERDLLRVLRACLELPLIAARRYVQACESAREKAAYHVDGLSRSRHIIFTGSYAHDHPFTNGTAYCAAKAGIDMAARTLGWELTDHGYRVHVVHPWHVKGTPMWQEVEKGVMESKGWTKEEADAYADRDLKMPRGLRANDVAQIVRILLEEPAMEWLSGGGLELRGGTR